MTAPAAGTALAMLDAFASVGARRFDVTVTDSAGGKVGFCGNRSLDQLRPGIPGILDEATRRQHNVIVRPRSTDAVLIQLDDLGQKAAARLSPVSFLVLCTSPGSYQAWVAVADGDADFARRLRKGAGADVGASGAARVSGSLNVKEKYAPNFPRVETVQANPGKVVSRAELEALGVVAPPERPDPAAHRVPPRRPAAKAWPSYQRCLDKAPPAREGNRPDVSRADFAFCLLAIDWGWSVDEAAARLMQESRKARENGETYAQRTAQSAAAAISRRGGGSGERGELPPPLPRAIGRLPRRKEAGLPEPRRPEQDTSEHQWTYMRPQVASEDVIAIGEGRYAHFRRERRYAQVQVMFSAPEGVDPSPGRELTDQFKILGWKWRPADPGKPWSYQLEKSTREDPTARGDSRDVLHEQFLEIILEYRAKHGMPPLEGARVWSR